MRRRDPHALRDLALAEATEMLAVWQEKAIQTRGPIIQGDAAVTTMEGDDE